MKTRHCVLLVLYLSFIFVIFALRLYHICSSFLSYLPFTYVTFSSYWMRLSRMWRIMQIEEDVIYFGPQPRCMDNILRDVVLHLCHIYLSLLSHYNLFCPSHMSHLSFTYVTLMSFIYAIFVLRNVFYVHICSSLMPYFSLLGGRHVWLNVTITQFCYCISGGLGTSWWPCHNVPGIKVNVCISGDFPWALHNFPFFVEVVWDRKILVMFHWKSCIGNG